MVPGADGVGVLENGKRVYFAFPRGPVGAMAERVAVKAANIVELPDDLDDVTAAAIANPGMSSWASLIERVDFQRGETVLINGANGASGRLAIQIAKHLGAGRVIAAGRDPACATELRALGADDFIAPTTKLNCTDCTLSRRNRARRRCRARLSLGPIGRSIFECSDRTRIE